MAFRYRLIHHPDAANDYREATAYFEEIDAGLAAAFKEDFRSALRNLTSDRAVTTLYAAGCTIRWIKLRRFSHKVFFEPEGQDIRFVLAVISGKRNPARIRNVLEDRLPA